MDLKPVPFILSVEADLFDVPTANLLHNLTVKHGVKPVWFVSWDTLQDSKKIQILSQWYNEGQAELCLLSQPDANIEERLGFLTSAFEQLTGKKPVSHRSANWNIDEKYFNFLAKTGYKVDASVTPHVVWKDGLDYKAYSEKPYITPQGILEIPQTIRVVKRSDFIQYLRDGKGFIGQLTKKLTPDNFWFNPYGLPLNELIQFSYTSQKEDVSYLQMFIGKETMKKTPLHIIRKLEVFFQKTRNLWNSVTFEEFYNLYRNAELREKV